MRMWRNGSASLFQSEGESSILSIRSREPMRRRELLLWLSNVFLHLGSRFPSCQHGLAAMTPAPQAGNASSILAVGTLGV